MNRRFLTCGVACAVLALAHCGPDFSEASLGTETEFEPRRPEIDPAAEVPEYAGDDEYVRQAQERYRTGLDVQQKIVYRTCTPFDGVCHNKKEYPDLHTPANFIDAIGAPCNLQPGDYTSVWDRCEPGGDRFALDQFDGARIEIAWIELIEGEPLEEGETPDATSPGLHVVLREPVPLGDDGVDNNARFYRDFGSEELVFARLRTRWRKVEEYRLWGAVPQDRLDDANRIMAAGVRQGDQNRNGVFGADMGPNIPMIQPGKPEESYLVGRIRGEVFGEPIPGSRMPLANQPLDIVDMVGLFCFIEGLPTDGEPNLADGIDYNDCSYADDPENLNLLGDGVTWATRVSKVLEANCGGCHGGTNPSEGFDVVSEGAYERLLAPSVQNPDIPLVTPGEPENSYLWLKLIGDEAIEGDPMPVDPLNGTRTLTEAELGDIETWIVNGAIENE